MSHPFLRQLSAAALLLALCIVLGGCFGAGGSVQFARVSGKVLAPGGSAGQSLNPAPGGTPAAQGRALVTQGNRVGEAPGHWAIALQAKPGVTRKAVIQLAAAAGGRLVDGDDPEGAIVWIDGDRDPEAFVRQLSRDPRVASAHVLRNYRASAVRPNGPNYVMGLQPALDQINLPQGWAITTGSAGVVVAVLDSGIDRAHADLLGTPILAGYSFVGPSGTCGGEQVGPGPAATDDDYGHGTEVSGVIAAHTNNATGVAGVAWQVSLLPVKVLDCTGSGDEKTIADAVEWAANQPGVRVINMSFGECVSPGMQWSNTETCPPPSSRLHQALSDAAARGIVLVAAAGNCGTCTYHGVMSPANDPNVLAVGATAEGTTPDALGHCLVHEAASDRRRADYSSYGRGYVQDGIEYHGLDVMAPGGVYTTEMGGGYGCGEGTSFAAPLVSGTAALMAANGITGAAAAQILKVTARPGPSGAQDTAHYGSGEIDAAQAISGAVPAVFAADIAGGSLERRSEVVYANATGAYSLLQIEPGQHKIAAWIDLNHDGRIGAGDQFGSTPPMSLSAGQQFPGVTIQLFACDASHACP
ncbi:MAG TPA: S8 family serine peptidase [Limnochordia bacterium]|nr:S8 family serine peptidase [Limnochordia bacterium]